MSKGAATSWKIRRDRGFLASLLKHTKDMLPLMLAFVGYHLFTADTLKDILGRVSVFLFIALVTISVFSAFVWFLQEFRYKRRVKH